MDGGGTDHLAQAVPTSSAVIVYAFNAADHLVRGLATARDSAVAATAAAARGGRAAGGGNPGDVPAGVGGDADDHRKCVLIRAAAVAGGGGGGGGGSGASDESSGGAGGRVVFGGGSSSAGKGGGFGDALAAGLSRPVLAEEMGETHLWVVDPRGRRHLAAAFVSLQRATVFLTLTASAQFPPFRVENRSSAETLAYRQVGVVPCDSGD